MLLCTRAWFIPGGCIGAYRSRPINTWDNAEAGVRVGRWVWELPQSGLVQYFLWSVQGSLTPPFPRSICPSKTANDVDAITRV
jgi:hypothetical protein